MQVLLHKRSGNRLEPPVTVAGPAFVIGSDASCDLRIALREVSPRHCEVLSVGDRVILNDLASRTGTEVNGRLILEPIEIQDGDVLRVGPVHFVFRIGRTADEPRSEPRGVTNPARSGRPASSAKGPAKIEISARGGISLVKVLDNALVTDQEIGDFTGELTRLIEEGNARVALDFGNVKHMSSQVIGEVLQASRRCAGAGGKLKLCKIQPQVAAAFAITGVNRHLDCYVDAQQALASDWPAPPPVDRNRIVKPVPVPAKNGALGHNRKLGPGELRAFRASDASTQPRTLEDYEIPVLDAPSPSGSSVDEPETLLDIPTLKGVRDLPECATNSFEAASGLVPQVPPVPARTLDRPAVRVGLQVLEGKAKGQLIEVRERRFLIGRDPECHLRPHSQWISRIHTSIEQRAALVFVRDLGSTNGTTVNSHKLSEEEEIEVQNGDLLILGPLRFRFAIAAAAIESLPLAPPIPAVPEPKPEPVPAVEPPAADWFDEPIPPFDEPVEIPVAEPRLFVEPEPPPPPPPPIPDNSLADLQFRVAVQPGYDVRLVAAESTTGPLPLLAALQSQFPQGWGQIGQLLQGLMMQGAGQGFGSPPAFAPSRQPIAGFVPGSAPIPQSVAVRPVGPIQAEPVARDHVFESAGVPRLPVSVTPTAAPASPAPTAHMVRAASPVVSEPLPQFIAAGPAADLALPRSGPVAPTREVVGPGSPTDLQIEILLKDLPEPSITEEPLKPDLRSEEKLSIQQELEDFLKNLPEGREEFDDDEVNDDSNSEVQEDEYEVAPPATVEYRPQPAARPAKEDITLDFQCPACGESGTAPFSRLGHQFFCKVCGAKFLIEGTGAVLVGDHVPVKKDLHDHRPRKKLTADKINDQLDRALFYWQDIPSKVKMRGFAAAVAAALLPWLVNVLFFNDPLRAQSLRTVELLLKPHSEDQLKALSTEKTANETIQWSNLVSPEVKKRIDGGGKTRVHVASQDAKQGSATVMVYFENKQQAVPVSLVRNEESTESLTAANAEDAPVAPKEKMRFLVLLWQKNPQGKWLLEGNKTLQYASRLLSTTPQPRRLTPRSRKPARPMPIDYGWDGGDGPRRHGPDRSCLNLIADRARARYVDVPQAGSPAIPAPLLPGPDCAAFRVVSREVHRPQLTPS